MTTRPADSAAPEPKLPTTDGGKRLLHDYYAADDARETVGYSLGERIAAIEAEAAAAAVSAREDILRRMLTGAGCGCWALAEDGYHAPDCPLLHRAVSAPFYAWTTKTSIRDGSPTGRFVVDWEEAERAIEAAVSAREGLDPRIKAVVDWVERQQNTPWAESWSQDFRAGYDAAMEEVDALLSELIPTRCSASWPTGSWQWASTGT